MITQARPSSATCSWIEGCFSKAALELFHDGESFGCYCKPHGRPAIYARLLWSVPREWSGRCFVLCTGESLKQQAHLVPKLRGRIIAVKHAVLLRPDADVLLLAGGEADVADALIPRFKGQYIIVRGEKYAEKRQGVKYIGKSKEHDRLCDMPTHTAGRDTGTSAIDLAFHFGATEIIVLGMDMQGGHYCRHNLQHPPEVHFREHMKVQPDIAADAKARGIRIVNVSPTSRVECFERGNLEAFL